MGRCADQDREQNGQLRTRRSMKIAGGLQRGTCSVKAVMQEETRAYNGTQVGATWDNGAGKDHRRAVELMTGIAE